MTHSNDQRSLLPADSKSLLAALDATAIVSMTDARGDIMYANDAFVEISKYARQELIGVNHRILKSGKQPQKLFDELWRTISHGKVWRGTIQNRAKDGSYYWVDTSIAPILGSDGKPERYIAVRFLVTNEIELRERLTEQLRSLGDTRHAMLNLLEDVELERTRLKLENVKHDAILAHIGDGVIVLDEHGKLAVSNKAAESLLGPVTTTIVHGRAMGRQIFFRSDGATPIATLDHPFARAARGEFLHNEEYFIRPPSKPKGKYISLSITPLRIDGAMRGAVAVVHDISRDKEIDRARNEFVTFASHQIRTPITGIRWAVTELRKHLSHDDVIREYVDDIDRASRNVTELAEQLLNKTRLELGNVQLQLVTFDAAAETASMIEAYRDIAHARKVHLIFEKTKEIQIVTDRFLMRTILESILSNAIDYTPRGGTVDVSLVRDGEFLRCSVADTGIGIPKEDQPNIFSRFFRASNAALMKVNGTGLGLYIAFEEIRLLGGNLTFASTVGKGSTFVIKIPLVATAYVRERYTAKVVY